MNLTHPNYVLGLHPSSRGFGWVLFEGRAAPFDWGTATIQGDKNPAALARFEELIAKYRPRVLALEAFDAQSARRAGRIRKLYRSVVHRAKTQGIDVRLYTRAQIGGTFAVVGAKTREAIAAAVADQVEALRPRLPKPRKIWESEHPSMALFCAAACALTHYATERE